MAKSPFRSEQDIVNWADKQKNVTATQLIQQCPIERLKPFIKNPRKHQAADLDKLVQSIKRHGFADPIEVNSDYEICVGHGRYLAAQKLGMQTVPVIVNPELDDRETFLSYNIANNKTAENSEWDEEVLHANIRQLHDEFKFDDPGSIGFEDIDFEAIIGIDRTAGNTDPDDVPQDSDIEARCKPGDLWELGAHRLLCGDATKAEDVALLLGGAVPFIMVTDPPYGVNYDPAWRQKAAEAGHLAYAARRIGHVSNDDNVDWGAAFKLFPGAVMYCWHGGKFTSTTQAIIEELDFEIRNQIIWSKSNFPISRGHYHWRHEPCWYAVRAGSTAKWVGDRKQTTIWEINLDKNVDGGHSTQKPIQCMRRPIENHGEKTDDVYDPFVGSGTTIIAAQQLGRRCFAMEIDPHYCDVAITRWEKFTGEKAKKVA